MSENKINRMLSSFAFKLAGEPDQVMEFSGYGAYFGNPDSYGDVIAKGAFKDALKEIKKTKIWPAMLLQHGGWSAEDMMPVGIWTDLVEDDQGLYVTGKLADTDRGREAYALLKMQPRAAITGLSIGYVAKEYVIGTKPEEPRRLLKKVDLWEISLVTFPANDLARVDEVKAANNISTIREFEGFLRDAGGYSHADARRIASSGFKQTGASRDETDGDLRDLAHAIKRAAAIIKP